MKRIMTVLLAVLLSVSLAACNPEARPPAKEKLTFDKAIIEPGEAYTDFEGMELRIVDGVWNAEEIKLELRWTNNTGFDVLYGESYSVERERDGQWESCVMGDNLAFHLIGYDLKTGTAQKKTYNLTDIFDISENGKYRFITDCNVYHKGRGGESAKCNLWVEFTVTRVGDTSGDVRRRLVRFTPQYIRTDGHRENAEYPVVKVIRSVPELEAYYEANKTLYSLGHRETPVSDQTAGFLDVCERYDAAYFENQILVMVLLEERSGSVRHHVDSVKMGSDGKLFVSIRSVVPEAGTCDMAQWHILIEPEKGIRVESEADVALSVNGTGMCNLP